MQHSKITGCIVRTKGRGGDVFRVRLNYGPHPVTGKRQQPYDGGAFSTDAAARKHMAARLYELNRTARVDPTRRTVAEVIVCWLADVRETRHPSTVEDYESRCHTHVLPAFGAMPIHKVTTVLIERWRTEKLASGTGKKTLTLALNAFSQVLTYAVRHAWLNHNPASMLTPLRQEHREMQVWERDEAVRFLQQVADHPYSPLWHLALFTGMRRGELIGLKWADLDLDKGTLRVRRSVGEVDSRLRADDTKNRRARTIDLSDDTVVVLREHRTKQLARNLHMGWGDLEYVCTSRVNTWVAPHSVTRTFHALIEACGVRRIRFHDLRHTCASILLANGTPIHVVSRQLGHASVSITMNVYAHLTEGQGREAAEVMGRALAGSTEKAPQPEPTAPKIAPMARIR